jgi:hypothetical protein
VDNNITEFNFVAADKQIQDIDYDIEELEIALVSRKNIFKG